MNNISAIYFFVFIIACTSQASVAQDNTTAPSYDCTKASGYVENRICTSQKLSNYDLLLAKTYEMYKAQLEERGITNSVVDRKAQISWIKNRNLCMEDECIKINYLSRIRQLLESIHLNEIKYKKCPPGGFCEIVERVRLGNYKGASVFLDAINITDCYTVCGTPYMAFHIYELKDGAVVSGTDWDGSFSNPRTKLDFQHKKFSVKPEEITTVYFGADERWSPDAYEIVSVLERKESGWIKRDL